ncbi:MAG TPA: MBOAT family O-acyltransferase [Bryobacteraceae bacterium]|nr:MBOAT family O-acyltransferase [Bryobacteraceae bacterium]
MPFHSFEFIFVFVPLSVAGYALLGRASATSARVWLILSSLVFYAWAGSRALPILAASIVFNYWIAGRLDPESPKSARLLKLALAVNLAALAFFKYTGFLADNIRTLSGASWTVPALILPLGISFFTVQQIMFLVDRHQGLIDQPGFSDYALFVSWFPYTVSGPITRWKDVIPQMPAEARVESENLARGTILFTLGLAKKVILAAAFSHWADTGFAHAASLGLMGSWLATAGFALQLYFDFSGYTDMARGVAMMFGVRLPENFNNPFRSLTITEFWQRWHMSLTHFITNYIYTPILRARRPTFRRGIYATFITMTLAGIWHGASWTFALFGLWHGIGLAANSVWRRYGRPLPAAAAWLLAMAFVLTGFAFFRAQSPADALAVIRQMFLPAHLGGPGFTEMLSDPQPTRTISMIAGIALLFYPANASGIAEKSVLRPRLAAALAFCLFVCVVLMNSKPVEGFIYRQF